VDGDCLHPDLAVLGKEGKKGKRVGRRRLFAGLGIGRKRKRATNVGLASSRRGLEGDGGGKRGRKKGRKKKERERRCGFSVRQGVNSRKKKKGRGGRKVLAWQWIFWRKKKKKGRKRGDGKLWTSGRVSTFGA